MAATRLLRIHAVNGTKAISSTFKERIDYIMNGFKTRDGELITACGCTANNAYLQFDLERKLYEANTNKFTNDGDIIAYHIRQAFSPEDNITPEAANEIGIKLADQFLKGNHSYVVCTHIDKAHIHNHIVFNATANDFEHKFNNFKNSSFKIREISDKLCKEQDLSIINPKEKGKSYKEWQEEKAGNSYKSNTRQQIDKCISKSKNYNEFITNMVQAGFEVKQGKNLAFKAPNAEKFTRVKSIGMQYTEDAIRKRIEDNILVDLSRKSQKPIRPQAELEINTQTKSINTSIETDNKPVKAMMDVESMQNDGLQQWAKIQNLKEASKTLSYLTENNIGDYIGLLARFDETKETFAATQKTLVTLESRIKEMSGIIKIIHAYQELKPVYEQYQQAGDREKFLKEHNAELTLYRNSYNELNTLKMSTGASVNDLLMEHKNLINSKDTLYKQYYELKDKFKEISTVKSNIDKIMDRSMDRENITKKSKDEI